MNMEELKRSIKKHEGLRLKPYMCTQGKLTIGFGRNLEDRGITEKEAENMLINDLLDIKLQIEDNIVSFYSFPDNVQQVILEMAYQLGVNGFLGFKKTIKLIEQGNYKEASEEMLKSKWAEQTPKRAKTLAKKLKGEF